MNSSAPIIAGIDFSASSPSVLRHALHAAGHSKTPVIAFNVLDDSKVSHWMASNGANASAEGLVEKAKEKLAAWIESVAPGCGAQVEIRQGRPAEELHTAVKDLGASSLVIAANDTTKKRLGSIASRCVRSAPCDVMVLRDWQSGDFSKIVVCCDFSETSARALSEAVTLADENNAELEIVNVIYPPSRDVWGEALEEEASDFVEESRKRVNQQMEKFLEPYQDGLKSVTYRPVILESVVPSVALTHHINDGGADLVVLGTRGQSRLMSYFVGTNAERLMHDSEVSVLAVRNPS